MISNRIQSMHEIIIVFQKRNNDQIWKPVQVSTQSLTELDDSSGCIIAPNPRILAIDVHGLLHERDVVAA